MIFFFLMYPSQIFMQKHNYDEKAIFKIYRIFVFIVKFEMTVGNTALRADWGLSFSLTWITFT